MVLRSHNDRTKHRKQSATTEARSPSDQIITEPAASSFPEVIGNHAPVDEVNHSLVLLQFDVCRSQAGARARKRVQELSYRENPIDAPAISNVRCKHPKIENPGLVPAEISLSFSHADLWHDVPKKYSEEFVRRGRQICLKQPYRGFEPRA